MFRFFLSGSDNRLLTVQDVVEYIEFDSNDGLRIVADFLVRNQSNSPARFYLLHPWLGSFRTATCEWLKRDSALTLPSGTVLTTCFQHVSLDTTDRTLEVGVPGSKGKPSGVKFNILDDEDVQPLFGDQTPIANAPAEDQEEARPAPFSAIQTGPLDPGDNRLLRIRGSVALDALPENLQNRRRIRLYDEVHLLRSLSETMEEWRCRATQASPHQDFFRSLAPDTQDVQWWPLALRHHFVFSVGPQGHDFAVIPITPNLNLGFEGKRFGDKHLTWYWSCSSKVWSQGQLKRTVRHKRPDPCLISAMKEPPTQVQEAVCHSA